MRVQTKQIKSIVILIAVSVVVSVIAQIIISKISKLASMAKLNEIVPNQKLRGCDQGGCGHFGAPRVGGRSHKGLDIVTYKGQFINAPISGKVTRHNTAYASDPTYKGITILSDDGTLEVKMFYLLPNVAVGSTVKKGSPIGTAQDISEKYSTPMTPHIHVEVRENGQLQDPEKYFA